MKQSKLPITEELDFEYLLELMPKLYDQPEYSWLPELFSIIGYERLIILTKYAGGESIRIPTLTELSNSIEALQWFYDINIKHTGEESNIPDRIRRLYDMITTTFNNA